MKTVGPFLFRFRREVTSPKRAALTSNNEFYDSVRDMMMVLENGRWIYAIDGQEERTTKKCDIEKGEDQKDDRMWR
jgi:hypothetical protein